MKLPRESSSLQWGWRIGIAFSFLLVIGGLAYLASVPPVPFLQLSLDERTLPSGPLTSPASLSFEYSVENHLGKSVALTQSVLLDSAVLSTRTLPPLSDGARETETVRATIAGSGSHKLYVVLSPTGLRESHEVGFPVYFIPFNQSAFPSPVR